MASTSTSTLETHQKRKRKETLCQSCHTHQPKYTCPRCGHVSCSLGCVKTHKESTSCSGIRDPTVYVPMNTYGYGEMMNDYVFLEGVGREVKSAGSNLERLGAQPQPQRQGGKWRGGKMTKRDILKMELEARDIGVEMLPVGMERRKGNMSGFVGNLIHLTIEFVFHPPEKEKEPWKLFTHRNSLDSTLWDVIKTNTQKEKGKKGKGKGNVPEWVEEMVTGQEEEEGEGEVELDCMLHVPFGFGNNKRNLKRYWRLDPRKPLSDSLKHTEFVEFPTVEVWAGGEFEGWEVGLQSIDVEGLGEGEELERKRRRVFGEREGKERISGLVGGYGSEEEEEEEEEEGLDDDSSSTGLGLDKYDSSSDILSS